MADISAETGVQQIASGNVNNAAALTLLLPAVAAAYNLYSVSWGRGKGANPSMTKVMEHFVVPFGAGWTLAYVSARWGGMQNPLLVGLIGAGGVLVYSNLLMADVDKEIKQFM